MRAPLSTKLLLVVLLSVCACPAGDAEVAPHWSLKPLVLPTVPQPKESFRAQSPIDLFVLAELERNGMTLSAPAEKHLLLRRIYFNLIGLPPTPQETAA